MSQVYTNGDHEPRPATTGPSPPYSLEAERSVLGSMLLDEEVIDDILLILTVADFFREAHQVIFEAIRHLRNFGRAVDAVTLADELIRREQFDKIGGDETLREIIDSVPHAANAKYYAGIVRETAMVRRLIDACSETLRECYRRADVAQDLVADAEERIFAVAGRGDVGVIQDIKSTIDDAMGRMQDRAAGQIAGLQSGYRDLDEITGGFKPGEVSVLAGRPSMGKTALAVELAVRVAESAPVLVVSVEMGPHALGDRLVASQARVDSYRFERPWNLTPDEKIDIHRAANRLASLPIEFDFTPGRDVAGIAAVARRMKRRRGLGLVVVDYLQLLTPESARGQSREQEVARLSAGLRNHLARHLNVPILILSQLNRKVEERPDKRPVMSDLRDSGSIEQDADVVLLLWRPEYYDPQDRPGIAELVVAKNRNGATGTVQFAFVKQHTRFDAIDRDAADRPAF